MLNINLLSLSPQLFSLNNNLFTLNNNLFTLNIVLFMLNNKQKGTLCFAKSVWRQKKIPSSSRDSEGILLF
mgnify:CR=1 FL=1